LGGFVLQLAGESSALFDTDVADQELVTEDVSLLFEVAPKLLFVCSPQRCATVVVVAFPM
jgi:hypothetical protein